MCVTVPTSFAYNPPGHLRRLLSNMASIAEATQRARSTFALVLTRLIFIAYCQTCFIVSVLA